MLKIVSFTHREQADSTGGGLKGREIKQKWKRTHGHRQQSGDCKVEGGGGGGKGYNKRGKW